MIEFSYLRIILGSAIRLWTMSVVAEGVYLMHKVDKAEIPVSLTNATNDALHHFIQLHSNLVVRYICTGDKLILTRKFDRVGCKKLLKSSTSSRRSMMSILQLIGLLMKQRVHQH